MYSLPYLFIFVLTFMLIFKPQDTNGFLCETNKAWYISIVLLLFLGLRGFVSTDWTNYYPFYQALPTIESGLYLFNFHAYYSTWEKGFLVFSSILKSLGCDYFSWCFIFVLIDLVVYNHFFNKFVKQNRILCFVLFILFQGFLIEINLMRNSKSYVLFLLSVPYLFKPKKSLIKYFLINFMGCLFHSSSAMYFIVGLLLPLKFKRKILITVFIIANAMFVANVDLLQIIAQKLAQTVLPARFGTLAEHYLFSKGSHSVFGIGFLERTFSFIFVMHYEDTITKKDDRMTFFCNSMYIYCLFSLIFANSRGLSQRLPTLFSYSYWIVYPNIYNCIKRNYKPYFLAILFLYGLLKTKSYFSHPLFYYDNLIFGIRSFDESYANFTKLFWRKL